MGYALGKRSKQRLSGVHRDLKRVVVRAIELTEVDFTVLEGRRSRARQQKLLLSGASRTMRSRHITGHAVDLGAYVDGEVRWDWPLYYRIAKAMGDAAEELGVPLIWGGVWDRCMDQLDGDELAREMSDYAARHEGDDLLDGPHFELPRSDYPADD